MDYSLTMKIKCCSSLMLIANVEILCILMQFDT